MKQDERDTADRVPEAELAEIARQLRGVLPIDRSIPEAAAPPATDGGGIAVLRFVAGFVIPGLLLMAIALLARAFG